MPGCPARRDARLDAGHRLRGHRAGAAGLSGCRTGRARAPGAARPAARGCVPARPLQPRRPGPADREWLRGSCCCCATPLPTGSLPFAVLCEAIDEPDRRRYSGRIDLHPEAQLDETRVRTLLDNLHRAGELCRELGFRAVIHPHAGTYIETDAEIERIVEGLDGSLVGLCLDSGHFRYGGADPAQRVRDYRSVLQHVHLKDCHTQVIRDVRRDDVGLEAALARGVFTELGKGDSGIDAVVTALRDVGYDGWVVVEQDRLLDERVTRHELVASQRRNLEYLRTGWACDDAPRSVPVAARQRARLSAMAPPSA